MITIQGRGRAGVSRPLTGSAPGQYCTELRIQALDPLLGTELHIHVEPKG